ncbi:glycosyl transferase, group 1 [Fictibacillus macauensis ZFHKF-1]|uniref:Glycosyl transferase, group 1 n=1 Tax=Fictibacillus macauensis ZFHKF-1 TaxID=1196324 RepID=I8UJ53_9BACL|nr:glycosyltransferase [Fictibacillus macauensis]EIT86920.1 glycosyl transferase, group 1 [Fictibacillus macauensis ZFHKF-1]
MKKRQQLVLLTNRFPYFPGEQFLETELLYSSMAFSKVELVPVHTGEQQRDVPDHVSLKLCDQARWRSLLTHDRQSLSWLAEEMRQASRFGIKGWLEMVNWMRHALRISTFLEKQWLQSPSWDLHNTVFYSYWLSPAALALALLKEKNKALVAIARAHSGDLYEQQRPLPYLPFQRKIVGMLDEVHCISRDGQLYLQERYPESADRVAVHRLGTQDPRFINPSNPHPSFHIVSCSYFKAVKRLPLLVEALKEMKGSIQWTHIGGGEGFTEWAQEVKRLLPSTITAHFTGPLSQAALFAYYQTTPIDVFLNVSEREGIPVTMMEAMSVGIPVIATNAGGVSEIVDGQCGVLLPVDVSPTNIAQALMKFKEQSKTNQEMYRQAARRKWETVYNAARNYTQFYESLAHRRGSNGN